jgi:hypothetical protein
LRCCRSGVIAEDGATTRLAELERLCLWLSCFCCLVAFEGREAELASAFFARQRNLACPGVRRPLVGKFDLTSPQLRENILQFQSSFSSFLCRSTGEGPRSLAGVCCLPWTSRFGKRREEGSSSLVPQRGLRKQESRFDARAARAVRRTAHRTASSRDLPQFHLSDPGLGAKGALRNIIQTLASGTRLQPTGSSEAIPVG